MDAIDGKQAWRTGTQNSLGCLFDHGCDVVSLSIMTFFLIDFMDQIDSVFTNYILAIVTFADFLQAHFNEQKIEKLKTSFFNFGVTEFELFNIAMGLLWFFKQDFFVRILFGF